MKTYRVFAVLLAAIMAASSLTACQWWEDEDATPDAGGTGSGTVTPTPGGDGDGESTDPGETTDPDEEITYTLEYVSLDALAGDDGAIKKAVKEEIGGSIDSTIIKTGTEIETSRNVIAPIKSFLEAGNRTAESNTSLGVEKVIAQAENISNGLSNYILCKVPYTTIYPISDPNVGYGQLFAAGNKIDEKYWVRSNYFCDLSGIADSKVYSCVKAYQFESEALLKACIAPAVTADIFKNLVYGGLDGGNDQPDETHPDLKHIENQYPVAIVGAKCTTTKGEEILDTKYYGIVLIGRRRTVYEK